MIERLYSKRTNHMYWKIILLYDKYATGVSDMKFSPIIKLYGVNSRKGVPPELGFFTTNQSCYYVSNSRRDALKNENLLLRGYYKYVKKCMEDRKTTRDDKIKWETHYYNRMVKTINEQCDEDISTMTQSLNTQEFKEIIREHKMERIINYGD